MMEHHVADEEAILRASDKFVRALGKARSFEGWLHLYRAVIIVAKRLAHLMRLNGVPPLGKRDFRIAVKREMIKRDPGYGPPAIQDWEWARVWRVVRHLDEILEWIESLPIERRIWTHPRSLFEAWEARDIAEQPEGETAGDHVSVKALNELLWEENKSLRQQLRDEEWKREEFVREAVRMTLAGPPEFLVEGTMAHQRDVEWFAARLSQRLLTDPAHEARFRREWRNATGVDIPSAPSSEAGSTPPRWDDLLAEPHVDTLKAMSSAPETRTRRRDQVSDHLDNHRFLPVHLPLLQTLHPDTAASLYFGGLEVMELEDSPFDVSRWRFNGDDRGVRRPMLIRPNGGRGRSDIEAKARNYLRSTLGVEIRFVR